MIDCGGYICGFSFLCCSVVQGGATSTRRCAHLCRFVPFCLTIGAIHMRSVPFFDILCFEYPQNGRCRGVLERKFIGLHQAHHLSQIAYFTPIPLSVIIADFVSQTCVPCYSSWTSRISIPRCLQLQCEQLSIQTKELHVAVQLRPAATIGSSVLAKNTGLPNHGHGYRRISTGNHGSGEGSMDLEASAAELDEESAAASVAFSAGMARSSRSSSGMRAGLTYLGQPATTPTMLLSTSISAPVGARSGGRLE